MLLLKTYLTPYSINEGTKKANNKFIFAIFSLSISLPLPVTDIFNSTFIDATEIK